MNNEIERIRGPQRFNQTLGSLPLSLSLSLSFSENEKEEERSVPITDIILNMW